MSGVTKLFITGTGCSHAREQMSTNVVVDYNGFKLGIECPHPIMHQLHMSGLAAEHIDAWFVTHIHADHVSGLESLAFYRWYQLGKSTTICAAGDVLGPLSRVHKVSALGRQTTLDGEPAGLSLEEVYYGLEARTSEPIKVGPFLVEVKKVKHVVPTYAVKVTSPDGLSFAYSGDTIADRSTVEWLTKADVFAYDSCGGPIHASHEDLAAMLSSDEKRRCILLHRGDREYESARTEGFIVPDAGYSMLIGG